MSSVTTSQPAGKRPSLPEILDAIEQTPPPGDRVLSVYLDTSPTRLEGQLYLISFRENCRRLRAALPPNERVPFDAAVAQAEVCLAAEPALGSPGLALFIADDPAWQYVTPLPMRPVDRVVWDATPALAPLYQALDDYERIAVLLFDKTRARLFTIRLGKIEARQVIESPVPGKQRTGGWFALAQGRYARHHEDHVLRHAKRTIRSLMALANARPFDRLVVGGPAEAVALLRRELPRSLRARLAGEINVELFASEEQVLAAALQEARQIERRLELEQVNELLDAASSTHAAVGADDTLAALADGRVHVLFIAETLALAGSECARCGRLFASVLERCPICGGPVEPVADVREAAVHRALAQEARVEVVGGAAAERLMDRGGLGAWTRY